MKFLFEDYVLDPALRELSRGGDFVAVGPLVFDILVYLVQNRDRVVDKDGLMRTVWAGRPVSRSTMASHINAVRKTVGDSGEEQRMIKTFVRKGFRFIGAVTEVPNENAASPGSTPESRAAPSAGVPALPDKPSIAVLAFQNLSGDVEQEYFADGVVEDIITALSRIRWLFVIARNSSFSYRGRATDIKQIGQELGVRYVLKGSIRRAGIRVRITGQLIDATTGASLWAERFEGPLDDIFELQDRISTSVVGAIAPQLERAEIERARLKRTENLHAYDYYLRATASLHRGSKEDVGRALGLFEKAIELDPDFASAYAMAAWCHVWRKINGWMIDRQQETSAGVRLARKAVELGRDDAVALTRSGPALAHLAGDLEGGIALLDRAQMLNPNLASAWYLSGFLRSWHGDAEGAIAHFEQAMRLSPQDPEMYRMQAGMAVVHLFAGRFDSALHWALKAVSELPSFLMAVGIVAASHALAGRPVDAKRAADRLSELDPAFRISNLKLWLPIHRPEDLSIFSEGLRRAGILQR